MAATRFTVAAAIVLSMAVAQAAEAPPGASGCSGCHANAGVNTPVPPLIGKPAADTTAAMVAFKAGQRPGTIMDRIAKGFSEPEIQAIAAWYAEQK